MRLTRAAAYAVFATVHIAENEASAPIQGRQIAESCHIPPDNLLKILQTLVRAQVLASARGPTGGFSLRRPASQITLLEIVEAIDGPVSGDLGAMIDIQGMEQTKTRVVQLCNGVAEMARSVLKETTLDALVGR